MNARKIIAGIAISAAVLVGTTGCSLNHNVDSLQVYAPSDGSQIDLGAVKFRNFIYLTKGGFGKLIGTVVNSSDKDIQVAFEYTDFDMPFKTDPITISAGETLPLGSNPAVPGLEITTVGRAGDLISIWLFVDGGTGTELRVPVLDGTLEQYTPYFLD